MVRSKIKMKSPKASLALWPCQRHITPLDYAIKGYGNTVIANPDRLSSYFYFKCIRHILDFEIMFTIGGIPSVL